MPTRNKRQLIGGLIGACLAMAAYVVAFQSDGDGTLGLLLSAGLALGGFPGFLVGALAATLVGAILDLWSGRSQITEGPAPRRNKWQLVGALIGATIGLAAFAVVFRNEGESTIDLLVNSGLILGGFPGFVVGALVGTWGDSRRGRHPPPPSP